MGVHFLVLGGLVGGRVVGSRGGGAGGDLGMHGVGVLEGEEINVRGEHGHGVGLERGNKCVFDFKKHTNLINPPRMQISVFPEMSSYSFKGSGFFCGVEQ